MRIILAETYDGYHDEEPEFIDFSELDRQLIIGLIQDQIDLLGLSEKDLFRGGALTQESLKATVDEWLRPSQLEAVHALINKLFAYEETNRQAREYVRRYADQLHLPPEIEEQIKLEVMLDPECPIEEMSSIINLTEHPYVSMFIQKLFQSSGRIRIQGGSASSIAIESFSPYEVAMFKKIPPIILPIGEAFMFAVWTGPVIQETLDLELDPESRAINHFVTVPPMGISEEDTLSNQKLLAMMFGHPEIFQVFLAQEIAHQQKKLSLNFERDVDEINSDLTWRLQEQARAVDRPIWLKFLELMDQEVEARGVVQLKIQGKAAQPEDNTDFFGAKVRNVTEFSFSYDLTRVAVQVDVQRYASRSDQPDQLLERGMQGTEHLEDANFVSNEVMWLHQGDDGFLIEVTDGTVYDAEVALHGDPELTGMYELVRWMSQATVWPDETNYTVSVAEYSIQHAKKVAEDICQSQHLREFMAHLQDQRLPTSINPYHPDPQVMLVDPFSEPYLDFTTQNPPKDVFDVIQNTIAEDSNKPPALYRLPRN